MKRGDNVKFNSCSEAQQKLGSFANHSKLMIGEIYTVSKVGAHSRHTNVHIELEGVDGRFNSVCFTVFETQKQTYKNAIRFNCTVFKQMFYAQPAHCYNCMVRDGYPQNLGGDWNCVNFKQKVIYEL